MLQNTLLRYLWFFMECILARGDNYNFTKKLAHSIKQTKDANAEAEEMENANHVCVDAKL